MVTGAAGEVGCWLVQLARLAGLYVVAQVSGEKGELVKGLGANEVVDYKKVGLKEWVRKEGEVEIVFDLLGRKTAEECWWCVKDGGVLVSIVEEPEGRRPMDLGEKNVRGLFFIMEPNGQQLGQISELVQQGRCRGVADSHFGFEEYGKAFEKLEKGHVTGKIAVKVVLNRCGS